MKTWYQNRRMKLKRHIKLHMQHNRENFCNQSVPSYFRPHVLTIAAENAYRDFFTRPSLLNTTPEEIFTRKKEPEKCTNMHNCTYM